VTDGFSWSLFSCACIFPIAWSIVLAMPSGSAFVFMAVFRFLISLVFLPETVTSRLPGHVIAGSQVTDLQDE
jgi:hypothetical protein